MADLNHHMNFPYMMIDECMNIANILGKFYSKCSEQIVNSIKLFNITFSHKNKLKKTNSTMRDDELQHKYRIQYVHAHVKTWHEE